MRVHVCTYVWSTCTHENAHLQRTHTHVRTSKQSCKQIHVYTWRANMSSDAKEVHLAHSNVFTCKTHLSTWNTNTCPSGTHMCVHICVFYVCTHVWFNRARRVPGHMVVFQRSTNVCPTCAHMCALIARVCVPGEHTCVPRVHTCVSELDTRFIVFHVNTIACCR